ncbi:MAG: hypothetical protein R2834_18350 [Rhodothermales bacterium]
MRLISTRAGLFLALCFAVAAPLRAQSAADILKKVSDRYSDAIAKIDNMEMVMRPEGAFAAFDKMTTYYEKTGGKEGFRSRSVFEGGMAEMMNAAAESAAPPDMLSMNASMFEKLSDTATLVGKEEMDGIATFVLSVDDLQPLMEDLSTGNALSQSAETVYGKGTLYIDAKEYVLRRMSFSIEVEPQPGAGKRNMDMEMTMSDFKTVGPLYYPHRMTTVMDNPMSAEERAEMQAQRMQIEAMLDQVPEAQRASLRKMLDAMGGNDITTVMVTESLKVNEGIPAGVFD